ncbi:hypothetical protein GF357_03160 [Candidatus Dojkabacteria bacterium]|nr:hypothetical protein [Candidatus Dojkabacteria bacterium]
MMECITHKEEINSTLVRARTISFAEKKSPFMDERRINTLLDKINEFKKSLSEKTEIINSLILRTEKITWYNDLDEECLMKINDLISAIKDVHSTMIRQYVSLDPLRSRGIAKAEIKEFKHTIDDVRVLYQDLESVFFFLPEMPDFKETSQMLSLV